MLVRCYIKNPAQYVLSFRANVWMEDVCLNSVGSLLQMRAADTAKTLVPMTVFVRCTDSFMVSAERR